MPAREIGGYLELERFGGEPYHRGAVALNCGRGCLAYLVELRGVGSMWVPDWVCGSVPGLLRREGVEVRTYRVGRDMLPEYDFEVHEGEWMLLVDYYGQLRRSDVDRALAACGGRLVVDETQGFFRAPWEGADTVYTCRKWFGVADGGYLATRDGARLAREVPRDESRGRMGFLLGRFERPASEFYAEASANNDLFASEPARLMSPITENLLRAVDYGAVRTRRDANWATLHAALSGLNGLDLRAPDGAFMYPLLLGERARAVRDVLIAERVYVPVLWPDVGEVPGGIARELSEGILPLPVDQRYGEAEMSYVADLVAKLLKGGQ